MSFDLSRITFDASRDFLGVVMQQGRVQLDADWNEWVAQLARRIQAGTLDTLGRAVVPRETPEGFLIAASGGGLTIGAGRIYVDGILAENHGGPPAAWSVPLAESGGTTAVDYPAQPYLPDPPELPEGGPHLVYVDVWQRDVSHLQQPELIEKAVGVDSTGRLQTVWQVKLLADVGAVDCSTPEADIPGWPETTRPSAGRLSSSTGDLPGATDPCEVPPAAGYTGRENQLYRVEIHSGGGIGAATFKWSRDNASVASRVTHINPARDRLTVDSVGRDDVLRFNDGDWIEVIDDRLELHNRPGELRRIRLGGGVDDATRTIELETALTAGLFPTGAQNETDASRHTRIRRWDQSGQVRREDGSGFHDLNDPASTGAIPLPPAGTRLFLEHGILVEFDLEPSDGEFRSGDYWTIAARSVDASIDILSDAPPLGIHHHYARLALVTFPDGETDCRVLWPPAFEGQGCDCTVCVDAEAHNAGTATLQQAIDAVKAVGGSVCLGAGTFRLRQPVQIDAAQSLRLRGQGWRTVLLGEGPGTLLQVAGGTGVTVENLTLLGSAGSGTTAIADASNVVDFRMHRVNILGLADRDATSVAVGLSGYVLGGAITDCALVAEQGIVNAGRERDYLLTAQLRAENNVLLCRQRGVAFDGTSLHFGACAVADNLVLNCSDAAIVMTGATLRGAAMDVSGNLIHPVGDGIRAGTDGLRVQNNEIAALADRQGANAIVLQQGLDPLAIDNARVIGNRIRDMTGHGLVIRHRLGRAMIKQNVVEGVGGAAIIMEEGGSAEHLVVENNSFVDPGRGFDAAERGFAAVQMLAVDRADVLDNVLVGVARDAIRTPFTAALLAAGIGELRAAANRLHGIGPPRAGGTIAAMLFLGPFRHVAVDDNSIERAAEDGEQLQQARWMALRIGAQRIRDDPTGIAVPPASFAYVAAGNRAFLLTTTRILAHQRQLSAASVRGNRLHGAMNAVPLVVIEGVESCLFADNHCMTVNPVEEPVLGRLVARVVNASNNRLIGAGDLRTLFISNIGRRGIVMGNISTGPINVEGDSLPSPLNQFNIFGV